MLHKLPEEIIYYICRNFLKDRHYIEFLRQLNRRMYDIITYKFRSRFSIYINHEKLLTMNLDNITELKCVSPELDYMIVPKNIIKLFCIFMVSILLITCVVFSLRSVFISSSFILDSFLNFNASISNNFNSF